MLVQVVHQVHEVLWRAVAVLRIPGNFQNWEASLLEQVYGLREPGEQSSPLPGELAFVLRLVTAARVARSRLEKIPRGNARPRLD